MKDEDNLVIGIPIESLELSIRAMNCLTKSGQFKTLEEIEAASNNTLRKIPGIGPRVIQELREVSRCMRNNTYSPYEAAMDWASKHSNLILSLMKGEARIIINSEER